jgi:hypothetical protein
MGQFGVGANTLAQSHDISRSPYAATRRLLRKTDRLTGKRIPSAVWTA